MMKTDSPEMYITFTRLAAKSISQAVSNSLPPSSTKDFMLWLLDDHNPHRESYLRMLGVAGSIELELKLFNKVIGSQTLKEMAGYISILNAYFAYETLSDNLGVGLASCSRKANPTYSIQKRLALAFNHAMIKKVRGSKQSSQELLKGIDSLANRISVNQKTLSPQQMQIFLDGYAGYEKNAALSELEHSFSSILVLNLETGWTLLESLQNNPIYHLLKESLIGRYESVSNIMTASSRVSFNKLADWGRDSILTIPTLAYCVGALEEVSPHPNFSRVIKNNLLYEIMADAALLTRLLNDLGTRLLSLDQEARKKLFIEFQHYANNTSFDSIFDYLHALASLKEYFYLLTRIRKDLTHGEFNVGLDKLKPSKALNESLGLFYKGINFYAELYQITYQRMLKNFSILNDVLGDDQASKIIHHFVQFHEYKYSMEFESARGDYAITEI